MSENKPQRIHRYFWPAIFLLVFLCVPYLFMGSSDPRYFGLPAWFYVTLIATILITAFSIHKIWRRWY
ncbi:MAG: hypothetical protein HOB98_04810 [Gammaproteobacteria bacterium]|nr:hypothetical protein [Gammaproteobacteria bacterium]MBT3867072.1 hypothetical protein [Gammaproteobacteria bacterium]MBT4379927.1 hypothetical protein [Gammaproteobacteria bacterium]MBT4615751.1 hypothetical protein [Gammaproteobacteria bacterium]MBT5197528.1 hypothetical protein [Gammaproteobacteria bacterium]